MIAADTSTWIAYLQLEQASDTAELDRALQGLQVRMVPVVLAELLSDSGLIGELRSKILNVPQLDILPNFWQRAGELRAVALDAGRKAMLPDTLIAQFCLDHNLPLLTRDHDVEFFMAAGLRLIRPTSAD